MAKLNGVDCTTSPVLLVTTGAEWPGFFEDVTEVQGVDVGPAVVDLLKKHLNNDGTIANGVFSFSAAGRDFDRDGLIDLMLISDFGTTLMYWGQPNGSFAEAGAEYGLGREQNGMGLAVGDWDANGAQDAFVTAIWSMRPQDPSTPFGVNGSFAYAGSSSPDNDARSFADRTDLLLHDRTERPSWAWGTALADLDLGTR